MNDHFTHRKAVEYADTIRRYWKERGKMPDVVVVSDEYAGYVVRSNMVGGKPGDSSRPVYLPVREVRLNKRVS